MITDVTGVLLTPGNGGKDCLGNGTHFDKNGKPIEPCCDECDYAMCCLRDACNTCERKPCVKDDRQ